MKFKNLNATSDKKCTTCGSWLAHWEKLAKCTSDECGKKGCTAKAKVGAHVKKVESTDNDQYIVPLCYECNQLSTEFELNKGIAHVSATPCS